MIARVVPAESLSADELRRWSEIRQNVPSLTSPFFSPTFTSIVAATRDDVRVGVLEEDGELLGFFPFQRGSLGSGRPVGSILSDYHGAVVPDDASWDAKALIRACGLKTWEFDHVVASQTPFAAFHHNRRDSMQIELSAGFEAYMDGVKQAHGPTITRLGSKTRKLEREHGPLGFAPHTDDPAALAMLLGWKSAQYANTGAIDILEHQWIREVLRLTHATQTHDYAGFLSFVFAGSRPIAAHLGIRSGSVCHSWFPAYDPEFAQYSPGLILLLKLAAGARQANIRTIDLGSGDYRYKRMLMNRAVPLAAGSVELLSVAASAGRARRVAKSLVRRSAIAPRVRRLARGLLRDR
jgi:CelD/BcsL family acetyltransferase involved in cellulose biosynthesis